MKNKKKVIFVLVVIVVVAVVTQRYFKERSHENPDIIPVSGNIEVTDAEVSFKIPGRVIERLVDEGETVQTGQVVARLDSTDLTQEVALRNAKIQAGEAVLAELEAGSRPEEIAQAKAVFQRARADVDRLQVDYERQKALHEKDVISDREYEASKSVYDIATARLQEAKEQLVLFIKGPRQEKIDQARANLNQAKEDLVLAETRLSYATLVSPLTGIVLSKNIEPGEYVTPGTPVVTVGDLVNVWLRAYINETDLGRVKVGQPVRVTTDTYPGKVYEGKISFISSQAEFTPKNVQTEKERVKLVYRVKINIVNPNMELKPGMPADAEILIGQKGK